MKVIYSEKASQIVEQFFVPIFPEDGSDGEWDLSNKEKEILKDVFPILEELKQVFAPYKDRIAQYYLMGYGLSLLHSVFIEMVDKDIDVEDVEDVHTYCLSLTEEEIQEHLKQLLNSEPEQMDKEADFWERLDLSTAKADTKWYFSQFYRKPMDSMQELVTLSRELVPLYQPYLDKGVKERQAFARAFSLEELFTKSPYLSNSSFYLGEEEEVGLYIVSPWIIRFLSYTSDAQGSLYHYFILSCRIDQLLGENKELDVDQFTTILKVISDVTRYNVLVELTKPHAKSKDIAQALAITGAAVSFHTQKLINAQLLIFNREDKHVKYNVNKELLEEVIAKLQTDFQLDTRK
ncbi:transcriptional regulator [Streptococcus varani]|uniref:Transcriptional regulator n=1 Tax=Streptococcus varani TaxID=1608583 RepID=A0A0E4CSP8_9STRE|nr:transcriptional regulator [Streptococcus varani]CQR24875.1 transcriptional regulator [Streptococcus varani]